MTLIWLKHTLQEIITVLDNSLYLEDGYDKIVEKAKKLCEEFGIDKTSPVNMRYTDMVNAKLRELLKETNEDE